VPTIKKITSKKTGSTKRVQKEAKENGYAKEKKIDGIAKSGR